ncbi:uncharacterized protein LOC117115408 [Anneissia japonica]|uniref:uncharacterized protein LOC117115408 n=1 Tax=Anneissia japonica TaxID=1529436 RepID=UPI0014255761|nr:uncharacterized protein LOC117115408 [Anneissia japonica]
MRDQERISNGNRLIVDLERFSFRLDSYGYILAINKTKPSDTNKYACAVFSGDNDHPVLKSQYGQLKVWQKPSPNYPTCNSSSKGSHYIEGSQVTLICTAEYLTPPAQLQWFYNDEPINFETTISNDISHVHLQFSFDASKEYYNAEFKCMLTTEYDSSIRQSCTTAPLQIDSRPTVNIEPVFATAGLEVSILCNATGTPEPFIHTWKFIPDIEQEEYEQDHYGRNLRLISPRTRMNGTIIECIAYNTAGYGKDQTLLIVQGIDPPEEDDDPILEQPPFQTDQKFTSLETNTVAIIFLIVGIFSVIIVFFAVIPVCFRPACREVVDANGRKIPQPDVYFEPKDRVLPPVPSEEQYASWRRSVAVQVSDTGGDLDSTYAEVLEEIEDKELSIIYSRKSIYI